MKEELATRQNSILVPFLVGGIVGAALGLLLAPKPGREMRKRIKDFTADTQENLSTAIGQGREFYDEAKVAVSTAVDAGKNAYMQEREKYHAAH
jgi:gas vesicle protein